MLLAAAKDEFRLLSRACMAQSSVSPLRESPGDAVLLMAVLGIANGAFLISHILAGRKNNFANGVGMGAGSVQGIVFDSRRIWPVVLEPQHDSAAVCGCSFGVLWDCTFCWEGARSERELGSPALLFAVFFISGLLSLNFEGVRNLCRQCAFYGDVLFHCVCVRAVELHLLSHMEASKIWKACASYVARAVRGVGRRRRQCGSEHADDKVSAGFAERRLLSDQPRRDR